MRDTANQLAAENERLKQQERPKRYFDLADRFGTEAADYVIIERIEWIDLSASLLSAAQSVLSSWEHSPKDGPASANLSAAVGELYGAVMAMDRKATSTDNESE